MTKKYFLKGGASLLRQILGAGVILIMGAATYASDTLTVFEVFQQARQHSPILQKDSLYKQSLTLETKNLNRQYLPDFEVLVIG